MRTKALILFFPFAVFLAETASVIPAMKNACAIIAAKKKNLQKRKKGEYMLPKERKECLYKN